MTPVELDEFKNTIPDVCIKIDKEDDTIFHCLWQCSQMKKFWEEVKRCFEEILGIHLLLEAKLLGIDSPNCDIKKKLSFISGKGLILAKIVITGLGKLLFFVFFYN